MLSTVTKKPLKIALGHQARVGKDTFAAYLEEREVSGKFSFAEKLYEATASIQSILGKPLEKDPALLQMLGSDLKLHYGDNIWVDATMKKIRQFEAHNPTANIIVTDIRFPNEMEALKIEGFTTIKIARKDRPIDRDPNHISETALAGAQFDYTINNNGTMEDFYAEINRVISDIRGERN